MGPELIANMRKQAEKFGAEFNRRSFGSRLSNRPFKIIAGKETIERRP